jgi:hypothetical protein
MYVDRDEGGFDELTMVVIQTVKCHCRRKGELVVLFSAFQVNSQLNPAWQSDPGRL